MGEAIDAKVRRIGGSTFALLSPEVVKRLGLHDGDTVRLEVTKQGKTLKEILDMFERLPPAPSTADHGLEDEDILEKLDRLGVGRPG